MDALQLTVGQPFEVNHQQGCGHTAQEFGEGQLNCTNAYTFDYQVNSKAEGVALTKKIADKLKQTAKGKQITAFDPDTMAVGAGLTFDERQIFGCTLNYDLFSSQVHNKILGKNYQQPVSSKYAAEFAYYCDSPTTKPLYKVEKS
jgi:hypothetical protein